MLVIEIPGLRTVSEANARDHYMVKARRKRLQTDTVRAHVMSRLPGRAPSGAIEVTLTRFGAKRLDQDNLAGSFKGVQDGVALALGIDDGDPCFTWHYKQELRKAYGVRIEIVAA